MRNLNFLKRPMLFCFVFSNFCWIKEIFDEVAVGSRFDLFEVIILLYLQEQLKIRVTASRNQIYFYFIVNIWKIKTRITKQSSIKVDRENHYPEKSFSRVLFHPWTSNPTTNRPLTQQIYESIIILERLDDRNMFILQNTSTAGKTYNYTLVYYLKNVLVTIKHIFRRQLYLFFLTFKF